MPRNNVITHADRAVTIIFDPDPNTGFTPGSKFGEREHKDMLRLGCYNQGTIIETNNQRYQVVPNGKHQTIILCQNVPIKTNKR